MRVGAAMVFWMWLGWVLVMCLTSIGHRQQLLLRYMDLNSTSNAIQPQGSRHDCMYPWSIVCMGFLRQVPHFPRTKIDNSPGQLCHTWKVCALECILQSLEGGIRIIGQLNSIHCLQIPGLNFGDWRESSNMFRPAPPRRGRTPLPRADHPGIPCKDDDLVHCCQEQGPAGQGALGH